MAKPTSYTKADGKTYWMFKSYLGTDPISGKKKYTTRRNFPSERAAALAQKRLELEASEGKYIPEQNYSFNNVKDIWLQQYKGTVRPSTYQRVEFLFQKNISKSFGDMRISRYTSLYCQKVVNEWKANYATYRALKSYTSLVFDYAVQLKVIATNPFENVKFSKTVEVVKEKKIKFYELEELKRFLTYCEKEINPMVFPAFRLLAFSGMRKGELTALQWKDIDFANQTINISKTVTRNENNELHLSDPKTMTSSRIISIDERTIQVLKKWRMDQKKRLLVAGININAFDDSQLIFSTQKNGILAQTTLNRWNKSVCASSGLHDISVHGFRHTHCSLQFEAGATTKEVQDRLGHSNVQTTLNIYAHVSKKKKDANAQRFAAYADF
ncbi:site-specific integrase [Enterococcus sp. LJL128]